MIVIEPLRFAGTLELGHNCRVAAFAVEIFDPSLPLVISERISRHTVQDFRAIAVRETSTPSWSAEHELRREMGGFDCHDW